MYYNYNKIDYYKSDYLILQQTKKKKKIARVAAKARIYEINEANLNYYIYFSSNNNSSNELKKD